MNFLSLFVLIPLLMMVGLALSKEMKQIRLVAVLSRMQAHSSHR